MSTFVKSARDGAIVYKNNLQPDDFYQESVDEKRLSTSSQVGDLVLRHWHFDGIRIGYSQSVVKEPVPLIWQGDMEVLQLLFNLKGVSAFKQTVFGDIHLNHQQHTAFYSKGFRGILHAEKGIHQSLIIQFEKEAFLNLTEGTTELFERMGESIIKGESIRIAPYHLKIGLPLQTALSDIIRCPYLGKMKKIFLYAKTLEILILQAEEYKNYEQKESKCYLHEADKEKIVFAREYLIQNIRYPPTIPELAKMAGINEYKLKKGFKELFQRSVFEYLTDYRMVMARVALLERQKTVSELAYELGYSSPQHFSMAFKKKFGLTPRQIKKT